MNHRPIPDDLRPGLRAQAAELYQAKHTIRAIAGQLKQTEYAIRKLLIEAGIPIRQGGPLQANEIQRRWNDSGFAPRQHKAPKLAPRQRDEIRQRLIDGEPVAAVAAEYGVSKSTVYLLRP